MCGLWLQNGYTESQKVRAISKITYHFLNKPTDEAYYYVLHHGGSSLKYGGLQFALIKVIPKIVDYEEYLRDPLTVDDLPTYRDYFGPCDILGPPWYARPLPD